MEISIREYARQRGVSHVTLLRNVKAGKIPLTASGKIDPTIADAAWERNKTPAQEQKRSVPEAAAKPRPTPPEPNESRSYSDARVKREYIRLERDSMDLDRVLGSLISVDEVQVQARTVAHLTREGMLAIPDRVASLVAAESDSGKIHLILSTEIRKALFAVAEQIDGASVQ